MPSLSRIDSPKLRSDFADYFKNYKAGDVIDWAGGKLTRTDKGARYTNDLTGAGGFEFDANTDLEKLWDVYPIRKAWLDAYGNGTEGSALYNTDLTPAQEQQLYTIYSRCGKETPVNTRGMFGTGLGTIGTPPPTGGGPTPPPTGGGGGGGGTQTPVMHTQGPPYGNPNIDMTTGKPIVKMADQGLSYDDIRKRRLAQQLAAMRSR